MSRAERRRKQREELKVLSVQKKREEFANKFIKDFTPAQINRIHQYAEVLKEVEIKKGIEIIEKFGNVIMGNAIQGALAMHTDISTEQYEEILKTIREFGLEDAEAVTNKTKKEGKMGQITIDQGMEEFYMAIEKKDVEMITKAKELIKAKINQKKVIEALKKEFKVPTGSANIAFRKAKEQILKEAVKEVVKEATKDIIEPVRVETIKEQVIKYLNSIADKIDNKTKSEILVEIKKKFKVTASTADTYYYAWKKQYVGSENCKPVELVVAPKELAPAPKETKTGGKMILKTNVNRVLEDKKEEKKEVEEMKEVSILEQLKGKLSDCSLKKESLKAKILVLQCDLEQAEKDEKAITVAVNALEGVNL